MGATPLGHGLTGLLAALLPLLAHLLSVHAASSAFFSAGFSPRLPFYHFCLVQKSEWHPESSCQRPFPESLEKSSRPLLFVKRGLASAIFSPIVPGMSVFFH